MSLHQAYCASCKNSINQCRLKVKATVLKDPTTTDTLANLIPASKAEEALVRKAGSKVTVY